jgi:hypothetical protein
VEELFDLFDEFLKNKGYLAAIAHVLIPGGVGIGQELAWLRKFDSGIAS